LSFDNTKWSASVFNSFDPLYWGLPTNDPEAFAQWGAEHLDQLWSTIAADMSKAGVSGIDLGVEPADWRSAIAWAGNARNFASRLSDSGLAVSSSYQSGHPLTDLARAEADMDTFTQDLLRHCEFVTEAGNDVLIIGAPLAQEGAAAPRQALFDIVNRFGELIKGQGARLAIHTEAYSDWTTEAAIDELMANTDAGIVSLCPDTGHIALAGGDPVAVIGKHWDRIIAFHLKDTRSSQPETRIVSPVEAEERMLREFCIAGEGIVDWPAIAQLMQARGFSGWCSAEVDNASQPSAATAAIVAGLRNAGFSF